MKVTGEWISSAATQVVCRILEDAGFQALMVGGCVRNALMGVPVNDIDIATDARPEIIMNLAEKAGHKAVPTGIEHGTVTVIVMGVPFEITTFRNDVQTDGRHAVVAFSDDVESDARRRDFTMNALYARHDGTVIDPIGGLPDVKERRVRFIDDPEARIKEDYLRILRFFRFFAHYGDPNEGFDADGLAACAALSDGISGLSRERVGAETKKLLGAKTVAPAVAAMRQTGVLAQILPGGTDRALAPLEYVEEQIGLAPDPVRRLAVLGGEAVDQSLRLSRQEAKRLALLREEAMETAPPEVLGYRHGLKTGKDILAIRHALLETLPTCSDIEAVEKGSHAVFPIKADDLMPGLSGQALGARLKELEERWIASGFQLGREQLLG
ncbi:MAG: CCA tRNA nucleotidyltransferase [Pseudomonadota bacterium]